MAIELIVKLKDSERTYRQKFLHYEQLSVGPQNDPIIIADIEEARKNFLGEPEDIEIQISMVYQ